MTNFRIQSDKKVLGIVEGKAKKFRHVYGTGSSETARADIMPFMVSNASDTHCVELALFDCRSKQGRAAGGNFMCASAEEAIKLAMHLISKL